MPKARKPADLFVPLAPENRLNAHFLKLRSENGSEPARLMMSEIYQSFPDADGNFAEQFQTAGFDARTFELYLYAYLSRSGYQIRRDYPYPDFVVKRAGVSCAIEATTANPSGGLSSGEPFPFGDEPTLQQINEKMNNELPIRFGSALKSKLDKRYDGKPYWDESAGEKIPHRAAG